MEESDSEGVEEAQIELLRVWESEADMEGDWVTEEVSEGEREEEGVVRIEGAIGLETLDGDGVKVVLNDAVMETVVLALAENARDALKLVVLLGLSEVETEGERLVDKVSVVVGEDVAELLSVGLWDLLAKLDGEPSALLECESVLELEGHTVGEEEKEAVAEVEAEALA